MTAEQDILFKEYVKRNLIDETMIIEDTGERDSRFYLTENGYEGRFMIVCHFIDRYQKNDRFNNIVWGTKEEYMLLEKEQQKEKNKIYVVLGVKGSPEDPERLMFSSLKRLGDPSRYIDVKQQRHIEITKRTKILINNDLRTDQL